MKQRAEVIFEKEETVLLRQSSAVTNAFCHGCRFLTLMATPEAIAIIANISEREIFRLIEAGEVHFIEGPKVYVCMNSLAVTKGEVNHEKHSD